VTLQGELSIPINPTGIIIFAHGSGSGKNSPRNRVVAELMNKDGLATLLVDLLTPEEEECDIMVASQHDGVPGLILNKFNIKLLSSRLVEITEWLTQNESSTGLLLGYFGASTGTAAALNASSNSKMCKFVTAIVSRSGRPDLVGRNGLRLVTVPTLLIVGGSDYPEVINWNKSALRDIGSEKKKVVVVTNATHLFEEAGALEEVAKLASGWFRCFFQIKSHQSV
jgi:putative phosphoribosyl transferase